MRTPSPAHADDLEVVVLFTDVEVRQRVRTCLERQHYRVVQPARLLEWVESRRPRVLVVTGDDAEAARARAAVTRTAPEAAVVVLVEQPTPARYRELLATCTSVLPVSASDGDVAVAVAGAWRELTCLPMSAARSLAGRESASGGGPPPAVTPRESGWLRALADGATVAGVARSAGYSPREMYRLLGAVYTRLGTANRTEALLCADRLGLLATEPPPTSSESGGPYRDDASAPTRRSPAAAGPVARTGSGVVAPSRGREVQR